MNTEQARQQRKRDLNPQHLDDPAWCHIHATPMKQRRKGRDTWYSHRTADGWCPGYFYNLQRIDDDGVVRYRSVRIDGRE